MKISTELKKATEECLYAEKMAEKWTDKALRRRAKVTELENLTMLNYLRKNKVSLDDLERMVAMLPSLGAVQPEETISKTEEMTQKGNERSENNYDRTTNNV